MIVELRSWFEVPAIAHFFHVFKNSFGLIEFEIEVSSEKFVTTNYATETKTVINFTLSCPFLILRI